MDLTEDQLIELAATGELYVSGSIRYANVAASLLGGVVVINPCRRRALKYIPSVHIPIGIIIPHVAGLAGIKKD